MAATTTDREVRSARAVPATEMQGRANPAITDRVRARWAGMAGRLGLAFTLVGFAVIVLAWNGAAGLDYAQGQLPYLLSGGFGGLGLIVVGAAVTVAESSRRDRAVLERALEELSATLQRQGGSRIDGAGWSMFAAGANGGSATATQAMGELVVAGRSSFHRPDCRLVAGRDDNEVLGRDDALDEGLTACRVCKP